MDIPGQRQQLLRLQHIHRFFTDRGGGLFEIQLGGGGDHEHIIPAGLSRCDQRFEHAVRAKAETLGHLHARQRVPVVIQGTIGDLFLIQRTHDIGLFFHRVLLSAGWMPVADPAIHQNADAGQNKRHGKHDDRKRIPLDPERIAADRRGDDGRQARHGCDKDPGAERNLGKPHKIGQQILGRAGDQKQQKRQDIAFFAVFQKRQPVELIQRKKRADGAHAEAAHEQEHQHAAYGRAEHAQQGALDIPEGVARGDLERLPRDKCDDDLHDDHADKQQPAPDAVPVHPGAEGLRLAEKADQRLSDHDAQNGDGGGKQQYPRRAYNHAPALGVIT